MGRTRQRTISFNGNGEFRKSDSRLMKLWGALRLLLPSGVAPTAVNGLVADDNNKDDSNE